MKFIQKLGYVAIGSMLTVAIMGTALAATGQMTITVDPINIQVNGTTFAPKDAQGNSVPVFSYNGTTYAPLRALAEAYGLKVGYDSKNNMATVSSEAGATEAPTPSPSQAPDNTASADYSDWTAEEEAAYQEFKGMWTMKIVETTFGPAANLDCYETEKNMDIFLANNTVEFIEKCCLRFDVELYQQYGVTEIRYAFILRGPWGWLDKLFSDKWECGYKIF